MPSSVVREPARERAPSTLSALATRRHGAASGRSCIQRVDALLDWEATPADATRRMRRVAAACAIGQVAAWTVDAASVAAASTGDRRAAAELGGRLRHIGCVVHCQSEVRGWSGVAFVPGDHPLADVADGQQAVAIRTDAGQELLLALRSLSAFGLDQPLRSLADGLSSTFGASDTSTRCTRPGEPAPTSWFVRIAFPHPLPRPSFVERLLADAGLPVSHLRTLPGGAAGPCCWVRCDELSPSVVAQAATHLRDVHRLDLTPFRSFGAASVNRRSLELEP